MIKNSITSDYMDIASTSVDTYPRSYIVQESPPQRSVDASPTPLSRKELLIDLIITTVIMGSFLLMILVLGLILHSRTFIDNSNNHSKPVISNSR